MKTIHLSVHEKTHGVLARQAKASGESVTALARLAVERMAWELEQDAIRADVAAYAAELGGTNQDLDPAWQEAGLEVWRKTE